MGAFYKTYSADEIDLIFIRLFSDLKEKIIPAELLEKHLANIDMELVLGNENQDKYCNVGLKTNKDGENVVIKVNVLKYKDEMIHFAWEIPN